MREFLFKAAKALVLKRMTNILYVEGWWGGLRFRKRCTDVNIPLIAAIICLQIV